MLQYRWKDALLDYGLQEPDAERVVHRILDDTLWDELDLGVRTKEDIIRDYERKYPADIKAIEWFIRHGEYLSVPRPEIWERVHELKQSGYGIYLLSNYVPKTYGVC